MLIPMPRNPRSSIGGYRYHALNPGNGRRTIRNPVRAGLVERAQDWLWSSAAPLQAGRLALDP
jgi:hypothetical protein